jgi:hypothetical protein
MPLLSLLQVLNMALKNAIPDPPETDQLWR